MTLQGGDGKAAAADAAKLDFDEADQLAASFRPAWEVEEEPAPAPAAATQILGSAGSTAPGVGAVDPKGVTLPLETKQDFRPPAMSTEALDSSNVLEVAPAVPANTTLPLPTTAGPNDPNRTQPAKPASIPPAKPASIPPASAAQRDPFAPAPTSMPRTASASARPPAAAPAAVRPAPRPASAVSTDELDALMPKRSNKGLVLGAVAVAVLAGVGFLVKLGMSDDAPADKGKTTTSATATASPGTTKPAADIPPPPSPDEMPAPAKPTETAAAKPAEPAPKAAEPAPKAAEPAPKPVAVREPARPSAVSRPAPVAKEPPPAAAPSPKTPPKAPGGGIVRDSPF